MFPSISARGDRVAVAWEGAEPDVDETKAWGIEVGWYRTWDGTNWSECKLLKGKPFANLDLPKVYYDRTNRLHLTGTKGPRYYTVLTSAEPNYEWLTPEWMYHSRGAAMHEDEKGNLWFVFDGQNSGTTNEIYVRMLPSDAPPPAHDHWTSVLRMSEDDKRPSLYPDVVARDPQHVTLVWMDYRHKSAEIYAKMFRDGRWSPDFLLSAGADGPARLDAETMPPNDILLAPPEGLQSEYPHLARAEGNVTWAVWSDSNGAQSKIMARRLDR